MKTKSIIQFGWFYVILAVAWLAIMIFVGIDELDIFMLVGGIGVALILAYKAYACFKGDASPTIKDLSEGPTTDATADDRIGFHRRLIFIATPLFLFLSLWIIYDLNRLESSEVESVSIWAPIAFLYKIGGYWSAVFTVPALGLFVVGANLKKITDLRSGKEKV